MQSIGCRLNRREVLVAPSPPKAGWGEHRALALVAASLVVPGLPGERRGV